MVPPAGCLNKNPSFVGSEYLKMGKTGSISSVNLSALTNLKMVFVVHNAINMGIIWKLGAKVQSFIKLFKGKRRKYTMMMLAEQKGRN
jgi:hypothetical protein